MVFITHFWKSLRTEGWRWLWCVLLAGLLSLTVAPAMAGAELEQLRLERREGELLLHAHVHLELGPVVEEALAKGVAVHFVAEAELMRERWYWTDLKQAHVVRHYRLAFQPLTRQWRLQVAAEPIAAAGSGSSIAQNFDSLQSALELIGRQSGWKLADADVLDSDSRQYLIYRLRLDRTQLPRLLQIGTQNPGDWGLSLVRQQRLGADVRP